MTRPTPHAVRTSVRSEPLVTHAYDYADSFEIEVSPQEPRTPEQLFRAALDRPSVSGLRWVVPVIHRHLLLLQLGSGVSPDHLFGWRILTSDTDVVHLRAVGPLLDGTIVGRRLTPERLAFSTFVHYNRGLRARVIWAITSPLHRVVAPFLLEQGAATRPTAPRADGHGPPL